MTTNTTELLKQKLQDEKVLLERELASVGRINPDNPEDWEATAEDLNAPQADENERADEITDFEDRCAIEYTLEERYNNIKNALKRIEENTYGTCSVCHNAIEEDRLLANPAATTCKAHMG